MKVRIFLFCQLTKGETGYSKIISGGYFHCMEFLREIELTFLISKKKQLKLLDKQWKKDILK